MADARAEQINELDKIGRHPKRLDQVAVDFLDFIDRLEIKLNSGLPTDPSTLDYLDLS